MNNAKFKCGYVAIIGRPNVGKSTLLNKILGQKISITSRKPQTTRHRLLGIKTTEDLQVIYVDTPGIHAAQAKYLNKYMNKTASNTIKEVDVIVFMLDAYGWRDEDDIIFAKISKMTVPVILAINKIDEVDDKSRLLPQIDELSKKMQFAAILPISAIKGTNVQNLEERIAQLLPENPALFPEDQITDRDDRFLASEIVREKLIRYLSKELPYVTSVMIEQFKEEGALLRIAAIIYVEREGQKAIVVGKDGEALKRVGTHARQDMEKLFEKKVFLQLWVKVKPGWTNDEKSLGNLGYLT